MAVPLTQAIVEEWVSLIKGKFHVRDGWSEIGIESPEGKKYFRVCLDRLVEKGIISNLGGGFYRKIDSEVVKMDLESADPTKIVPLLFPFGEHEFATIYPKSIVIVAGSKQAGKTEYLYEFIKLNMNSFNIDLFNSETGAEQMKVRFLSLGIPIPPPIGGPYERYDNFADVVSAEPDRISVIDYLDMNSEVYLVGTEIDAIFRKIRGVAVIGLQKPPPTKVLVRGIEKIVDRDLAYGGGFTAKRAILYITMGSNKLKLLYVKTPKQKKVNPQNMTWSFSFDDNGHFTNIQRSYGNEL